MAGWELIPSGSGDIFMVAGDRVFRDKKLGRFTHRKVNRRGNLVGLVATNVEGKPCDGIKLHITRETITVDGYERPWIAVMYMDGNKARMECAAWVWQLICEGKFESNRCPCVSCGMKKACVNEHTDIRIQCAAYKKFKEV